MSPLPPHLREGIRFLDEPTPSPVPPKPPKPPKRRREWPIGILAFLAVVGTGIAFKVAGVSVPSAVYLQEMDGKKYFVNEAPRIEVETFNGEVSVLRGEPGEVQCVVNKTVRGLGRDRAKENLRRIQASMSQEGDTIRVAVTRPDGRKLSKTQAAVTLRVPADATLRLKTRNGKIQVYGVQGPVEARSSNGSIDIRGGRGLLAVETSNGPIDIEAHDAILDLETSNGSIQFRGSLAPGHSSFQTRNGSVALNLPESQGFRLDAKTSNGKVATNFDLDANRHQGAKLLVGDTEGLPLDTSIKIRSSNGSVRVWKDRN